MTAPRPRNLRHLLARVTAIIAEDGYATDESLAVDLGIDLADVRTVASILYRTRRADRIDAYLVAPGLRELPHPPRQAA